MAAQLIAAGLEPARLALEAPALDEYRTDRLSVAEIRELLGFNTRMQVDSFLTDHGAFLPYTADDLEHDREVATQAARGARTEREHASDQRRAG